MDDDGQGAGAVRVRQLPRFRLEPQAPSLRDGIYRTQGCRTLSNPGGHVRFRAELFGAARRQRWEAVPQDLYFRGLPRSCGQERTLQRIAAGGSAAPGRYSGAATAAAAALVVFEAQGKSEALIPLAGFSVRRARLPCGTQPARVSAAALPISGHPRAHGRFAAAAARAQTVRNASRPA